MAITVGGTLITFNDSSTQSVGFGNFVAGTVKLQPPGMNAGVNQFATTTLTKKWEMTAIYAATTNFQAVVVNNNNGAAVSAILYMRIYKNGVAADVEVNSGTVATNATGTITSNNVTYAAGDVLSFYFRSSTTNINAQYGLIGPRIAINPSAGLNLFINAVQFTL